MITILVTGGSGQLGMSLKKIFNSNYWRIKKVPYN